MLKPIKTLKICYPMESLLKLNTYWKYIPKLAALILKQIKKITFLHLSTSNKTQ